VVGRLVGAMLGVRRLRDCEAFDCVVRRVVLVAVGCCSGILKGLLLSL
jgi:hypothetical protein